MQGLRLVQLYESGEETVAMEWMQDLALSLHAYVEMPGSRVVLLLSYNDLLSSEFTDH